MSSRETTKTVPSRSASGSLSAAAMTCCLLDCGRRCQRAASSHSYSKRLEKAAALKRLQLSVDTAAKHTNICAHHRRALGVSRQAAAAATATGSSQRRRRRASQSADEDDDAEIPSQVKLSCLAAADLRRYKKFFGMATKAGLNKQQLADALLKHFATIPVDEKKILTYFIYTVKTQRNRLDQTADDG